MIRTDLQLVDALVAYLTDGPFVYLELGTIRRECLFVAQQGSMHETLVLYDVLAAYVGRAALLRIPRLDLAVLVGALRHVRKRDVLAHFLLLAGLSPTGDACICLQADGHP